MKVVSITMMRVSWKKTPRLGQRFTQMQLTSVRRRRKLRGMCFAISASASPVRATSCVSSMSSRSFRNQTLTPSMTRLSDLEAS